MEKEIIFLTSTLIIQKISEFIIQKCNEPNLVILDLYFNQNKNYHQITQLANSEERGVDS